MPIARPIERTLARHATCSAVLIVALCICAAPAFSSSRSSPSLVSWDRAANAACNSANVAIEELGSPSSEAVEIADLTETVTIGDHETAAIAAMPSPPVNARTIARFLSLSKAGTSLARELITALRAGDTAKVTLLENRSRPLNNEYNALAVRLGARTCAVNPQPGTLHASGLPTA